MKPALLQLSSPFFSKVLYVLAIYFFLKGHNQPGGGFIAGLMVASALMLNMLAFGTGKVRKSLYLAPIQLVIVGIFIALFSAILPMFWGLNFFTALWLPEFSLPLIGQLHIGSPLLFDLGVFLSVIGFTVSVIFDLENAQ